MNHQDDITAAAPFDARRSTGNTVGHISRIEHRLYIALTGSISCLTTIRSPQAPRNEIPTPGSSDPLLDTWSNADARTTTALNTLHNITPGATPPPPAAKPRRAAAWTRDHCLTLHRHVNDLHNAWWEALDADRLPWVIALRNVEDNTRSLRNQLDWTMTTQPAPPGNLTNRRCTDPLDRGCTRVVRDSDGDSRRICGACRTQTSRSRKTA